MEILCYNCKKKFERDESRAVARSEECPHCRVAVRCCKMCDFYDPNTYNECREIMAERVIEKENANFCNSFRVTTGRSDKEEDKKKILDAAESLFKK